MHIQIIRALRVDAHPLSIYSHAFNLNPINGQ
jgi:hypothetical protein